MSTREALKASKKKVLKLEKEVTAWSEIAFHNRRIIKQMQDALCKNDILRAVTLASASKPNAKTMMDRMEKEVG